MSLGLIPIFSTDLAPELDSLGEALAAELEALEEIASEADLAPLSAFADQREVPEDFDGHPDELDELFGPCTDWFEARAGAEAVGRLIAFIEGSADAEARLEDRAAVLQELGALQQCLQRAATARTTFRLTLA